VKPQSLLHLLYGCCSGEHGRFSVVGESSLRIDSVMEADSALYTCRASNQQDFVDAHALLKVQGNCVVVNFSALTLLIGHQEEHPARKKLSDGVLAWLSVWSLVQMICIWSS